MTVDPSESSNEMGVIEAIKRSIIRALVASFASNYPNTELSGINVSMEYPAEKAAYPAVWVQFSFRSLQRAGIAMLRKVETNDGTTQLPIMDWIFSGNVTLNIVAMSSVERDQIADGVIATYAFGDVGPEGLTFASLLQEGELIDISLNQDEFHPQGQTVTIGAPWESDLLVYEDSYNFAIEGQFHSNPATLQLVRLSRIDVKPIDITLTGPVPLPADGNGVWQ